MPTVTPRKLREAIATTLRDHMTRAQLEAFCQEDLDLDLADLPDGITREDLDGFSKFYFVQTILERKGLAELLDLANRVDDELDVPALRELTAQAGLVGVAGELKNLIFAADGPKPKIVFRDAINNDIAVVENERYCLVYDRALGPNGLTWRQLTAWWADREGLTGVPERQIWMSLYSRLAKSLANEAEQRILQTYVKRYQTHGSDTPALIPQVYLHYDPYTQAKTRALSRALPRQRMNFLLLLPNRVRVVIECDGKQHYADDLGKADPQRYAQMVSEDRQLRLRGYEVYRFGGEELREGPQAERRLMTFFNDLATRHGP
ncbi:MAG: hypothetical protein ACJ72W_07535 [Actinoallomurus sp.]